MRYCCATVLAGIMAGGVGAALIWVLDLVQGVVWGAGISKGLASAAASLPAPRILLTLTVAGGIGAVAWWGLSRTGHDPVGLRAAVSGTPMPLLPTAVHVLTQVVIVGMGASVGKEVAPREMSASLAGTLSDALRLSPGQRRILVASAAGAGLAAVYSVPVSGTLFALEVFLMEISPLTVLTATLVSGIAVLVAHGAAGGAAYYRVPSLPASPELLWWTIPMAVLLGALGWGFSRMIRGVTSHRPKGARLFIGLPLGFLAVGGVALAAPTVLGNGHELAQRTFDVSLSSHGVLGIVLLFLGLALAKTFATALTIGVGAWGGTLTPSVAIGGALGVAGGALWSLAVPNTSLVACAFLGGAVFLATTMRAPLTAVALLVEFTHSGMGILVPALIGVVLAVATARLLDTLWERTGVV